MHNDMLLCGWRVRSALPLPELLPWQGDDRPVNVEIAVGGIPQPEAQPVFVLPHSRLWADGAFLLALDGVGRFWVQGGQRVKVEPAAGVDESELRAFLLGSVLGVLCHQRGLLPIHASAVRIGGRAILIAGNSGAGKSTLAAALGARGHALAADDVAAFDPAQGLLLPAFPNRKLATDVLEALALDHRGLVANRPGQPKFHVSAQAGFDPAPLPALAVYLLSTRKARQSDDIERADPALAIARLDRMVYRRAIGLHIQPRQALFHALSRLMQTATVHLLPRDEAKPTPERLDRLAERVETHARGLAAR